MCCLIGDKVNLIVLQILLIFSCRVLLGKAVWVVTIRQKKQLDVHAFCKKHINSALACMNAGIIAVEDDRDVACDTMNETNLVGCQSRSRRRYNVLNALLMHRHHVCVTFH